MIAPVALFVTRSIFTLDASTPAPFAIAAAIFDRPDVVVNALIATFAKEMET